VVGGDFKALPKRLKFKLTQGRYLPQLVGGSGKNRGKGRARDTATIGEISTLNTTESQNYFRSLENNIWQEEDGEMEKMKHPTIKND